MKDIKKPNSFLPAGYELPDKSNGYMKFQSGDNKFRIVGGEPIVGYEVWNLDDKGINRPTRAKMENKADFSNYDPKSILHFWIFTVYNYEAEMVQVLEVTQKSIQRIILSLTNDEDWGDPREYDLLVTKTGEGKDNTKYDVKPKPKKELTSEVKEQIEESIKKINLDKLFDGGDLFEI